MNEWMVVLPLCFSSSPCTISLSNNHLLPFTHAHANTHTHTHTHPFALFSLLLHPYPRPATNIKDSLG